MILAIDQGTTRTTCIVFDDHARPLASAAGELRQRFPRPGWVEHDPEEIWTLVLRLCQRALHDAKAGKDTPLVVGIVNQRETVCAWEAASGKPLSPAIVWQDRRTAPYCERLRQEGLEPEVRKRTGLLCDPYFSATKMKWLLEHVDGLAARAATGEALLGTIDSWLCFKLTGEHLTDVTNASRTLLYNLQAGDWDPWLLELFQIPRPALARVCASAGRFGELRAGVLPQRTGLLAGVAGDQQAALFGQGCVSAGMAKATFGTGSFVLLHTGGQALTPPRGIVSTAACDLDGARAYAFEGSIFAAGAAVQWLRDGLGIIEDVAQSESLAAALTSNEGVYFVPAFNGLGSPHWDPFARGVIVGLSAKAGKEHIVRAALEAIAYQTADVVHAMNATSNSPIAELRVDGGASANRWLMQFQADVLGIPVARPQMLEMTVFGAALLAGAGAGLWTASEIAGRLPKRTLYQPQIGEDERSALLAGWHDAVRRTTSQGRLPARGRAPARTRRSR